MAYPPYYIIKNRLPQPDLNDILKAISLQQEYIEHIRDTKNEKSRKIELVLKPGLEKLGFSHSVTNRSYPLFQQGCLFEVDYFNPPKGIAIEIERSNLYTKVWLALIKMLEAEKIRHGLIMVPTQRIFRNKLENSYEITYKRLRDSTRNLLCHLDSLIVIGY
ncbi:MAG: hypothetical protein PHS56_04745 [Eubacteriales bacterium]|nr:hypothetical protein [Eubacteriales bacterium]